MFDYDRNVLPNAHLARLEASVGRLDQAVRTTGMSVGYPAWNLLYYSLLCSLPPSTPPVVVETGTNHGGSTIVMAQALADAKTGGRVLTVDVDPAAVERARANVRQAGLTEYVSFHTGDSVGFLRRLDVEHVHFAFLDASHARDAVVAEFEAIHPFVSACSGKIYFDNTSNGGVASALADIRRRFGGNVVEFPACSWLPPGNALWQA